MRSWTDQRSASMVRRAVPPVALGMVVLGAGCTSLLGVDGDYQVGSDAGGTGSSAGPGGGAASTATSGDVTASSAGGGGGGAPPFDGLETCGAAIAFGPPAGLDGYVLAPPDASAPRARVTDGLLSVAWVQRTQPGAAFGFVEQDGSVASSNNDCRSATPFADANHRLAAVSLGGNLVVTRLDGDDVVIGITDVASIRDALPTADGGKFLVTYGADWAVHDASRDDGGLHVTATSPVTCPNTGVVDAAFVDAGGALVATACEDGTILLPFGELESTSPRSIAAAQRGGTIFAAYRDALGVRVVRGVVDLGETTTSVLSEEPPHTDAPELDRVSVAAVPEGALIAWSREDEPGVTSLAVAFCPPSGACCEVSLEAAIDAKVSEWGELAASQRMAPAAASMPDGSDLALAYAHVPVDGANARIVVMRLAVTFPGTVSSVDARSPVVVSRTWSHLRRHEVEAEDSAHLRPVD